MIEILTSAQMRAIEAAAIESGSVTGLELMERAGAGVVAAVLGQWPDLAEGARNAVVLCGPGNNGGDGFVVARLLKARGWEVRVFLLGDPARLPPDARAMHDRWLAHGTMAPLAGDSLSVGPPVDLCVDALFGIGLTRPVANATVTMLADLAAAFLGAAKVVAVDIASGLCADSGRVLGGGGGLPGALRPELTVTFHRAKAGHLLAEGAWVSGRLRVIDIGLPQSRVEGAARLVQPPLPAQLRKASGHKFEHGHALVMTGGMGRTGAARLAARGALRIGAGVVTLAAPGGAMLECACQISALMLRRVEAAEDLAELLADRRIAALCLGPGLGVQRAADLLPIVLKKGPEDSPLAGLVLDADALTALAPLVAPLPARCVLTPHAGEFARLFPDLAARLAAPAVTGPACSKLDIAREAALRAGCVVLLKGPDSVIAAPDGRAAIHSAEQERAAPGLATAGSGDVLAGFITGLMARGLPPFEAACVAVWLHVECARAFGPGLIAEDLPEALPAVLRALGA